ncbi:3-keto-disaccharide hydrolase [Mucilaginibacter segetis]|uniref:DUF1080 domain-containing protein n=1 Tax=Mucilaginibacter segetis TaxID=2793071 RepID=A0A934UM95_9SPHI|nr:DUF1080 domain-containing protein [Mucilaginibacter segetis]MBK0378652.1 DUF1080 domain-containing protein [Mucilaginibacter segetis]
MRKLSFIIIAAVIAGGCNSNSSNKQPANYQDSVLTGADSVNHDWVSLFDGKTTKGWHTYGKDSAGTAWKAEDGILHLDASQKADWQTKNGGDILTDDEYSNFDFKAEWKISRAGNSGIMFYVKEDTAKYEYPWYTGPETQIADNKENEDGKLIKHRAGDLYDLISISKDVVKPAGEWNKTEIIANNGKLDILVNDERVLSTTMWDDNWKKLIAGSKFKEWPDFGTFKKGHIALQDHGADVWFRNIQIKKL